MEKADGTQARKLLKFGASHGRSSVALILIIDDEASIRRPLQVLLARAGHEVVSAPNGSEAVRLWRHRAGDMVITDIHMPEKNGLEDREA
jgi:CheY-like chemotaxis protein